MPSSSSWTTTPQGSRPRTTCSSTWRDDGRTSPPCGPAAQPRLRRRDERRAAVGHRACRLDRHGVEQRHDMEPGVIAALSEVARTGAAVSPVVRYADGTDRVWFGGGTLDVETNLARHLNDDEISRIDAGVPVGCARRRVSPVAGHGHQGDLAARGAVRRALLPQLRGLGLERTGDGARRAARRGHAGHHPSPRIGIIHRSYSWLGLYYYTQRPPLRPWPPQGPSGRPVPSCVGMWSPRSRASSGPDTDERRAVVPWSLCARSPTTSSTIRARPEVSSHAQAAGQMPDVDGVSPPTSRSAPDRVCRRRLPRVR